jgi:Ribbon-helix-helix protein, copG family
VRTTLTLDEDVAAKLRSQARRTGRPFKEVVNEAIRRGLAAAPAASRMEPFKVRAHDLGALKPGLDLDNIGDLLERVEGPLHR